MLWLGLELSEAPLQTTYSGRPDGVDICLSLAFLAIKDFSLAHNL